MEVKTGEDSSNEYDSMVERLDVLFTNAYRLFYYYQSMEKLDETLHCSIQSECLFSPFYNFERTIKYELYTGLLLCVYKININNDKDSASLNKLKTFVIKNGILESNDSPKRKVKFSSEIEKKIKIARDKVIAHNDKDSHEVKSIRTFEIKTLLDQYFESFNNLLTDAKRDKFKNHDPQKLQKDCEIGVELFYSGEIYKWLKESTNE